MPGMVSGYEWQEWHGGGEVSNPRQMKELEIFRLEK